MTGLLWNPLDYLAAGATGAGAVKLSTSAVAPLVAAARPYETFGLENLNAAWAAYPKLPKRNSRQGRGITESARNGDILVMPWYAADAVAAATFGHTLQVSSLQYRPEKPEIEVLENGRQREKKYQFVCGQETVVGMHPGIPVAWLSETPTVLVAEGLLKGDSALTALLLSHPDISPADLAWGADDGDIAAARDRLGKLLTKIRKADRVLVLTIAGVYNWKHNPEWATVGLKDRETWVGFDGDVATNPNVHRAASQMWGWLRDTKHTEVKLLAPTVSGDSKVGIDDYLAEHGDWAALVAQLSDKLPPAPPTQDADKIGHHRISPDGTALEVCVAEPPAYEGAPVKGRWQQVLGIGGRIRASTASRQPTRREIETGQVAEPGDLTAIADEEVALELSWSGPDGQLVTRSVEGPLDMLHYLPDQWTRQGARFDPAITRHPEWPPPRKVAEDWRRAIKLHRADELQVDVRWKSMGWVPVAGYPIPAFVVGDQIISADPVAASTVQTGVTDSELRGAGRFGVGDLDERGFEDPEYRDQVRRDIESVLDTYYLADAWTDRSVAATVLAIGLRPTIPGHPPYRPTLYVVGPPGKGKTYTVAAVMGFWSRHPGDFTRGSLPGSAKDTAAAMEIAVSRAPIWAIDDVAPAVSARQSEGEQDAIGNLIRNVFNGTARNRSNRDLGAAKVNLPIAQLMITAENEHPVPSIRARCITLEIGHGALNPDRDPTDRIDDLYLVDGAPARLSQHMIRYLQHRAQQAGSWTSLMEHLGDLQIVGERAAAAWMQSELGGVGDYRRHAEIAAYAVTSLLVLKQLASAVGVAEKYLDLFTNGDGLYGQVYTQVRHGQRSGMDSRPGRAVIEAVAGVLSRKRAHIGVLGTPGVPPANQDVAARLGWEVRPSGHDSAPRGDLIGWLLPGRDSDDDVVFLDHKAAFAVAQQVYPHLVPPGSTSKAAWQSALGEGLLSAEHLRGRGQSVTTGRVMRNGSPVSGVPVPLQVLLNEGRVLDRDTEVDALKDAG